MAVNLTQIRKGMVVKLEGQNYQVVDLEHRTPGNLRAFVQLKLKNMSNGSQFTKRFSADEQLETVFLEKRSAQYLYPEGKTYVFMDNETYEQSNLGEEVVGDKMGFIPLNSDVVVMYLDGTACDLELPSSVILEVTESEPSIRGNTATNVTKKAVCNTGLEIKVPQHIDVGDRVVIDTRDGSFLGRSNKE
ncbi:MAG: elongation factor P [Planctomycetes bacterium]|nr:elongation factor P [Planctomycetota bacterium]MCW8140994.1 elongation factor P [Planctomycetota bacterium]